MQDTQINTVIAPEIRKRFEEIVDSRDFRAQTEQYEMLEKAFVFACAAHRNQTRLSGDPYVTHPLEVMGILAEMQVDTVTMVGALLHDVVEDTGVTIDEIAKNFGPVVAILVDGMTKLASIHYQTSSNEERQAEYFRKMLLSMAQDLRVILIKLADRLHNMRTIDAMPVKTRRRIAEETMDIYAALAHRFGINRIKWELEDLAFKVLNEVVYRRIAERIALTRQEREAQVEKIITPIQEELDKQGINAEIRGRAKHFYSIYNKINRRGKSFEEILDLYALRIVVDTIPDCYRVLGVVHSTFTPISERFSDYIAMPKGNMYQSLHTKVIDDGGHTVEIQIRTEQMDLVAEVGIAAHWQYKNKKSPDEKDLPYKEDLSDYYKWLRELIAGSREEDTSAEFMKTLKVNLFTDEIYVFTPKGRLVQLPKESTPIDFAFSVHTDVGLKALGAKVNGLMAPLDYHLKNGDSVEVLVSDNSKPSLEWLSIVKTSRARSKIRKYFKNKKFEESIKIGRELFIKETSAYRKKLKKENIFDLVNSFGYQTENSFYGAIGSGDIAISRVVDRLEKSKGNIKRNRVEKVASQVRAIPGKDGTEVDLKQYNICLGNCCNPLPGDRIIGYLRKGEDLSIHCLDCPNISDFVSKNRGQLIEVEWDVQFSDQFETRLRILAEDRKFLLRDVADIISKQEANICAANILIEGTLAVGTIVLQVRGLAHLLSVIKRLKKVKQIIQVERISIAELPEKVL